VVVVLMVKRGMSWLISLARLKPNASPWTHPLQTCYEQVPPGSGLGDATLRTELLSQYKSVAGWRSFLAAVTASDGRSCVERAPSAVHFTTSTSIQTEFGGK